MSEISWFRFEKKDLDFPFYRKNPYVPKSGWIVLLVAMFAGFIAQAIPEDEILGGLLFFLIIFIPLLYYLKWDIKAIFQKPTAREVGLALLLFAAYIVYAVAMDSLLYSFSMSGSDVVSESYITIYSMLSLVFALMGEELIKFIPFMFFLRLFYKYSNNRKLSVIVSMIIVMICFGLLHAVDTKSLLSVIVIQGFGSIFEFYGYIKTKNLLISYLTHFFTDFFIFAIILLGA